MEEFHLLIASTGSVASIKIPILVKKLLERYDELTIRLVMTTNSEFFIKDHIDELSSLITIYRDADEWNSWKKIGDPIIHIDLTKWADLMLIAPLDANTLAKLANGMSDNLVTSICRAWSFTKPIMYAPAMNTVMWNHPVTSQHTQILDGWGYVMIPPISKTLACGDTGVGAMENVDKIIQTLHPIINVRNV